MAVLTDAEIAEMLPATFTKPGLTEEEYFGLCAKYDDFFVEYTADGTVIFMPGTDPETGIGVLEAARQLANWAAEDGRGIVTGGWLIDPLDRTVTIYRPGRDPGILTNPTQLAGDGPVAGFVLDLSRIF
jgi:Uma2 family endonuclease